MKIYVASAFSKDGKGGNKAGVCLLGEALSREDKLSIAKRLGYSETAYVSAANEKGTTFRLEYFTPLEEVPLCGHATIASFVVMKEKLGLSKDEHVIQTKEAFLAVKLENGRVWMQQGNPSFGEFLALRDMAACFGAGVVHENMPIQIVSTGLRDIMLPIKDLETLDGLRPDFGAISVLSRQLGVVGAHAFAIDGGRVSCRNFAPLYGIPEESATGTANCALASYLWRHGIIRKDEYAFDQGRSLGSPSEILVRLETGGGEVRKASVGGYGYLVREEEV